MINFRWRPPDAERVPILIHPEARDALRYLLTHELNGTGIGYSQFIMGAVKAAGAEWHEKQHRE